ncbi:MAG: universal stress protein [Opitutaceae bacterium]|nr:universal stress protein [Opitutaceae bacterium]
MKTFLVPIDFSAVTDHVVDTAVSLARSLDGKIVLVHIIQPPVVMGEDGLPIEVLQDAILNMEQAATKFLARIGERVAKEGVKVETILGHGAPAMNILEEAEKAAADFIVMGSHGHGKFYDLILGGTASRLVKRSKCAVIIIPPEAKSTRKPTSP